MSIYPYEVRLDDGRRYCGYSPSGRFGIGVGTQFDVVSIEEPEPEFKDGDKVEVGYEISDVWNPYTYALKFNGQHYVYGVRDTLIIAQKVRKPEPKYKYRWLMQNPLPSMKQGQKQKQLMVLSKPFTPSRNQRSPYENLCLLH